MEQRHDWAKMVFTPELFKYVFMNLLPEVIVHSQSQDEEQVRDHYDRGDDFYGWCVPRSSFPCRFTDSLHLGSLVPV